MMKFAGAAIAGASVVLAAQAFAAEKQVLAEVVADLNGDGVKDRAVLLRNADGDDVDLAVYLSASGRPASQPSLYKAAIGSAGDMAGMQPELSVTKAGSLVMVFQNDSIGRDRWRQSFTLAVRGGVLVVAGYSYQSRDTLDPNHRGACDMNLLTGHGTRNGKPVQLAATAPISLAAWSDKSVPAACNFD